MENCDQTVEPEDELGYLSQYVLSCEDHECLYKIS